MIALLLKPSYAGSVAKKEATGFGDSNTHSGHTAQRGFFTSVDLQCPFNGGLGGDTFGYAGGCVCRFANPAQFRLPHLAMSGGVHAHTGGHMPSNLSPVISHFDDTNALSVDRLYKSAFDTPRDPRSFEYKAGVRAALAYRIEGKRISRQYEPGTAQFDAYYAGIDEGHAIWRNATASVGGAA